MLLIEGIQLEKCFISFGTKDAILSSFAKIAKVDAYKAYNVEAFGLTWDFVSLVNESPTNDRVIGITFKIVSDYLNDFYFMQDKLKCESIEVYRCKKPTLSYNDLQKSNPKIYNFYKKKYLITLTFMKL